jgi:hypothetical protein
VGEVRDIGGMLLVSSKLMRQQSNYSIDGELSQAYDRGEQMKAEGFIKRLEAYRSSIELKKYHRYFKFDEGYVGTPHGYC